MAAGFAGRRRAVFCGLVAPLRRKRPVGTSLLFSPSLCELRQKAPECDQRPSLASDARLAS